MSFIKGYPILSWWVIDQVSTSSQENIKSKSSEHYPDTLKQPIEKMYSLILPYAGPKGNTIYQNNKR